MTQAEQILAHLQSGRSISPLEALAEYACFRLGARIFDLKAEGHDIQATIVHDKKRDKHYATYRLASRKAA